MGGGENNNTYLNNSSGSPVGGDTLLQKQSSKYLAPVTLDFPTAGGSKRLGFFPNLRQKHSSKEPLMYPI